MAMLPRNSAHGALINQHDSTTLANVRSRQEAAAVAAAAVSTGRGLMLGVPYLVAE